MYSTVQTRGPQCGNSGEKGRRAVVDVKYGNVIVEIEHLDLRARAQLFNMKERSTLNLEIYLGMSGNWH